jgi:hypothetical protein
MKTRYPLALALVIVCGAPVSAAHYRTKNFDVEAPTEELAQQVGKAAERYRKEKAVEWLGKEMPAWDRPCSLRVTIGVGPACGATTFNFDDDRGGVLSQTMRVEGPYDQVLDCVLPHEVTHTVLAHHFGRPVPRWADEGGASLSETAADKARYAGLIRQYVESEPGRVLPLSRLFNLGNYPTDVLGFYTESYSVAQFLVKRHDRATFLEFLSAGRKKGWDRAVREHYGFRDLDALEDAWLKDVRRSPRPQVVQVTPRPVEQTFAPRRAGQTSGFEVLPGPLPDDTERGRRP